MAIVTKSPAVGTKQRQLLSAVAKRISTGLTPASYARVAATLEAKGLIARSRMRSGPIHQLTNAGYTALGMTTEQAMIHMQSSMLLDTLYDFVPVTTVNYAVEDAKKALMALLRQSDIKTDDRRAQEG